MAISQFFPFISLLTIVAIQLSDSTGTKFDLIHRDRLPGFQHLTQAERITQMFYRDMRMQRIQNNNQHVGPTATKRQTLKAAVTPIVSGHDSGTGEYFAEFMVGTPAQKFLMVVDTGSDLTWVDCQYKGTNHKPTPVIFNADKSTSFKTINCSSTTCQDDLSVYFYIPSCHQQNDSCPYDYTYGGESAAAQGIFAYETVTFDLADGKTSALKNTLIGCTNSKWKLESIRTGGNGIMGLGHNPFSLPNQASKLFGNGFSYCLVDLKSPNTTSSKLFFGSPSTNVMPKIDGTMQSTALELNWAYSSYGVNVQSISIGGKKLSIPENAWVFRGHGTIIDSGSTFTYLLDSVYEPVIKALANSLRMFNKARGSPFELCYKTNRFNDSAAPDLEITFVEGAKFRVPGKSYLTDVADGVKCVAFVKKTTGYNIIGNMLQQNNLWVFDTENEVLSFASSSCTN